MATDPVIQAKADDIRMKVYGEQVRESLASGLEAMSEVVVENTNRQDTVETQFQQVVENTTGKDVISAPEIIAARNNEANLKARLDKEHQQVTAQLAQTETEIATVTNNPNNYDGPIVCIIDDDIRNEVKTIWQPVLATTGVKITFACITALVGTSGYMTLPEIRALQDDGHEIVSHTVNHQVTNDITVASAETEYPQSKQW